MLFTISLPVSVGRSSGTFRRQQLRVRNVLRHRGCHERPQRGPRDLRGVLRQPALHHRWRSRRRVPLHPAGAANPVGHDDVGHRVAESVHESGRAHLGHRRRSGITFSCPMVVMRKKNLLVCLIMKKEKNRERNRKTCVKHQLSQSWSFVCRKRSMSTLTYFVVQTKLFMLNLSGEDQRLQRGDVEGGRRTIRLEVHAGNHLRG